jgi:pteridine reductase
MQDESTSLAGKTVLITGGARRVGAAIAKMLHGAGANLVVHYRNSAPDAEALVGGFNEARAKSATSIQADLLDLDRLPALVEFAVRSFGSLDVLINNASTFYATKIGEITSAAWDDLLGTNLKVPIFLSQAAAPALRSSRGLIINIVDIHALRPLRNHTVYCAAKAGLHMVTRSLAKELGPEVRVNGISPGPVLWPEHDGDSAGAREDHSTHHSAKNGHAGRHCAHCIVFRGSRAIRHRADTRRGRRDAASPGSKAIARW